MTGIAAPICIIALASILSACKMPERDPNDIGAIRSKRDMDAYNATVSSEGQKLTCTREQVIGTNFRQYVCITNAQLERQREATQGNLDNLGLQ